MRDALSQWAELINLKIVETGGESADLRIAASALPATAWAYTPSTIAEGGDVWFGTAKGYYTNPVDGTYAKITMIHELGHALGSTIRTSRSSAPVAAALLPMTGPVRRSAPAAAVRRMAMAGMARPLCSRRWAPMRWISAPGGRQRHMAYTVMSYSSYAGDGRGGYTNGTYDYAQTPMIRDIAAIQHLYGANFATRSGDTVYSWNAATGEKFVNGQGQVRRAPTRCSRRSGMAAAAIRSTCRPMPVSFDRPVAGRLDPFRQ